MHFLFAPVRTFRTEQHFLAALGAPARHIRTIAIDLTPHRFRPVGSQGPHRMKAQGYQEVAFPHENHMLIGL